jgi:hypothetical protein
MDADANPAHAISMTAERIIGTIYPDMVLRMNIISVSAG